MRFDAVCIEGISQKLAARGPSVCRSEKSLAACERQPGGFVNRSLTKSKQGLVEIATAPEIEPAVARRSRRCNARRLFLLDVPTMTDAIQKIVDAYVRLHNRQALENLRMHRQRLAMNLKARTDYDFSLPLLQVEEEIAIIEAGSERLTKAA
jgi:hypothetical protein